MIFKYSPCHHSSCRPRISSRRIPAQHWRSVSPPRRSWWLGWCQEARAGRGLPHYFHSSTSRTCWKAREAASWLEGYIFAPLRAASRRRTPCLVGETLSRLSCCCWTKLLWGRDEHVKLIAEKKTTTLPKQLDTTGSRLFIHGCCSFVRQSAIPQ